MSEGAGQVSLSRARRRAGHEVAAPSLCRDFYARDAALVARELVGAVLVYDSPQGRLRGRIVETEAYRGPEDLASHSARGRRTPRNEAMWGPPGHVYMFLLYGLHWAFNVVTGAEGVPHAVLLRAVEPLEPLEPLCRRRNLAADRRELTNGPGKLCAALGLDRSAYGVDLCAPGPLWIERGGRVRIGSSPRVNVDYAEEWARVPWRFYERGNRYVSVAPRD